MSTIPNDLAVASEFAAQDLPPAAIAKQEPTEPTKAADPAAATSNVEPTPNPASFKAEPMEADDTLDKAIAGKTEKGYESSDIDISSDEDDSSDSSSSSSDSSDDDDDDDDDEMGTTTNKKSMGDEDEEQYPDGIVKTAHEIVDIVVEKPQFEMSPQTEIIFAGSIFQIIDNVIVIHCKPHSEYSTLDQGSLLVYENREVMGEVFETFGPVARPYYSVRFNDAKEINQEFAKVGQDVYFVPSYQKTQIVETEKLRKIKGTDASNVYDEEVGEDELEFSDDEKEMEYKQRKNREKKMKKRGLPVDHLNKQQPQQQQQQQPSFRQRGQQRYQQRKQARDLPDDFDSALAAYEQYAPPPPPRQQQSYADLMDDYMGASSSMPASASASAPAPPHQQYYPLPQQQQQQQYQSVASQQQTYQNPADLVSALYKSYGGTLPTQLPSSLPQAQAQQHQPQAQQPQTQQQQASARSLFSQPPPPISDLEKPN